MGRKVWSQRDRRHRSAARLTDAGTISACEYRRSGCGRGEEKAQITLVGIAPHSIDFMANRSARLVAIVASHQKLIVPGVTVSNVRHDSERQRFFFQRPAHSRAPDSSVAPPWTRF